MTEQLVLAELRIDANGVVTGIGLAKRSMDELDTKLKKTGKTADEQSVALDLLTKRMFNLKTATAALLGSFTLAGLILQISNLTQELITGTDWWKKWSGAIGDAFNELAKGEGVLDRTMRHVKESTGISGFGLNLPSQSQVDEILKRIADAKENLAAQPAGAWFGATPKTGQETEQLRRGIDALTRALFQLQQQSGMTVGAFDILFGTDLQNAVVRATELAEGFTEPAQKAGKALMDFKPTPEGLAMLDRWNAAMELDNQQLIALEKNWEGFSVPLSTQMDSHILLFYDFAASIRAAADEMAILLEQQRLASIQHQILQTVIYDGASLIAQALAGQVQSYRLFIKSILIEIARLLIVEGIGNMAKGFAALATGYGSAVAGFYFRAASLDFAGATLAGLAARATGGGEGRAGTGRGYGSAGPGPGPFEPQGAQQPASNITIVVEGDFVGDEAKLREIAEWIRNRQGSDNA